MNNETYYSRGNPGLPPSETRGNVYPRDEIFGEMPRPVYSYIQNVPSTQARLGQEYRHEVDSSVISRERNFESSRFGG